MHDVQYYAQSGVNPIRRRARHWHEMYLLAVAAALALWAAPALAELEIPPAAPAAPAADAPRPQEPALWTQTLYHTIPQDADMHRLVVWCDGDALLYSLSVYVHGEGNRYGVEADSIRLNGLALDHRGHSAEGELRADLLAGPDIRLTGGSLPLVLPGHGSLMIPVGVAGEEAARVLVDMTYVSGLHTECSLDSFEPGMVGAFFPDYMFGDVMRVSTEAGLADFNSYLEDTGAGWRLEPDVRVALNSTRAVGELRDAGIRTYLGFPAAGSLLELAAGNPDDLAVSCCATVGLLDADDHIFRTAPSDTTLGLQLARLITYNGMDVLLPVWRPHDSWEDGYVDAVSDAFSRLGGTVDGGVAVESGGDPAALAARLADRINMLSDEHGADRVAVFVAMTGEAALLENISKYDEAWSVGWFGNDYIVGEDAYVGEGTIPEFASAVGYAALQVEFSERAADIAPALEEAVGRPPNHDMLAAYESAWILGLAMMYAQSSDPGRLAEAIPHVAARYTGTLGPMALDANGDLAADSFGVWQVRDGAWTLAGIMR